MQRVRTKGNCCWRSVRRTQALGNPAQESEIELRLNVCASSQRVWRNRNTQRRKGGMLPTKFGPEHLERGEVRAALGMRTGRGTNRGWKQNKVGTAIRREQRADTSSGGVVRLLRVRSRAS